MRALLSLLIILFATTTYAGTPNTVICTTCVTDNEFSIAALAAGNGEALVINTNDAEARRFMVIDEPIFNVKVAEPLPLTASDLDQIAAAKTDNYNFDIWRSTLTPIYFLGNDPNGCGGSTQDWIPDSIRNGTLKPACDAHDLCYANGVSRNLCDRALKQDILLIAERVRDELRAEGKPIRAAITYAALVEAADLAFSFVDANGQQFYCNDENGAPINQNTVECLMHNNEIDDVQQALREAFFEEYSAMSSMGISRGALYNRRFNYTCQAMAVSVFFHETGETRETVIIFDCRIESEN